MNHYSIEQRDEQLLYTSATIRYHVFFDKAEQHLARIIMEFDATHDFETLVLPVWTTGSYKVREFASNLGNLRVTDALGNALEWKWIRKNALRIRKNSSGTIRLEYLYYAFERTVRTCHINRWHASLNPSNVFFYAEGRQHEMCHVYFHHDRQRWTKISTSLSPVKPVFADDEPIILGALNYDILADSPVEIGNHFVGEFEMFGAKHEVAIAGSGSFDPEWITERIKKIVYTEAVLWEPELPSLPYDRYVFIISLYPGTRGGLEHSRSSVNAWDSDLAGDREKITQFLTLLCHEFFHTWNVKRIRPRELGPFDYNAENYTELLWLAEGATSYYDEFLAYRCGFLTREQYLRMVAKDQLGQLHRVKGREQMSLADSSYLAWVKLYLPTPDSNNRFPSYYLKGGVVFILLELLIISETNGQKRLDDVMRALWKLYKERPESGVTQDEFLDVAERITGLSLRTRFLSWLHSTDELPYNEYFSRFGLRWEISTVTASAAEYVSGIEGMNRKARVSVGIGLKVENGKLLVASVEDGSPAEKAGLGVEDEIISINGVRVASSAAFEEAVIRKGLHEPSEILAAADDKLFTTSLTPKEAVEFSLIQEESITDEQRKLLDYWLS